MPKYSRTAALGLETAVSTMPRSESTAKSSVTGWSYIECCATTEKRPVSGSAIRTEVPRAPFSSSIAGTCRSAVPAATASAAQPSRDAGERIAIAELLLRLQPFLLEVLLRARVKWNRRSAAQLVVEVDVVRFRVHRDQIGF